MKKNITPETLKKMASEILEDVRTNGYVHLLLGNWSYPLASSRSSTHQLLEQELGTLGVKVIKIYNYAALYVSSEISEEDEAELLEIHKEIMPKALAQFKTNSVRQTSEHMAMLMNIA